MFSIERSFILKQYCNKKEFNLPKKRICFHFSKALLKFVKNKTVYL